MKKFINSIINGDCLNVMKKFDDNSVDHILTDAPYNLDSTLKRFGNTDITKENYIKQQIDAGGTVFSRSTKGFMGKTWDVLPSQEIFNEMYRVIKPAGFCFLLMTPRQDSLWRVMARLEGAGFNINFSSLYWVTGEGFPKSSNTSKAIDKRIGAERVNTGILDYNSKGRSKRIGEYVGSIAGDKNSREHNITAPATPQAKYFDGYGTMSLKPAVEVVIVAMKPLSEKTYIDQALAYYEQKHNGNGEADINKGCVDIDGCRLPIDDTDTNLRLNAKNHKTNYKKTLTYDIHKGKDRSDLVQDKGLHTSKGRFPANLISEGGALDTGDNKTPSIRNAPKNKKGNKIIFNQGKNDKDRFGGFPDTGSFDRYFSIDKWFENKLKELPKSVKKTFPCLVVPKPSVSEKNAGCEGLNKRNSQLNAGGIGRESSVKKRLEKNGENATSAKNIHPTIKPLKLMIYLIQLMSDKNDIILDPFLGSGTTAVACRIQQRRYIGIEKDKDYFKIAEARINKEKEETLF